MSDDHDLGGTGNLTFAGGTLAVTGNMSTSRNMTLSTSGTFNVSSATTLTASGVISGSTGSLATIGAGTLTLSGTNNYGGGTTVNNGVVNVTNTSGLGTGTVNENGGKVSLQAASATGGNSINGQFVLPGHINNTLAATDAPGVVAGGNYTVITANYYNVAGNGTASNLAYSANGTGSGAQPHLQFRW